MIISLCGFKYSGKTSVGREFAKKNDYQFIDTDRLIEERFVLSGHFLSISMIHQRLGEKQFRRLEQEVVLSLNPLQSSVIATGGGVVLDKSNVLHLKSLGVLIYLKAPKEVLYQRMLKSKKLPTFLDPNNIKSSFFKEFRRRQSIYEQVADLYVEITHGK